MHVRLLAPLSRQPRLPASCEFCSQLLPVPGMPHQHHHPRGWAELLRRPAQPRHLPSPQVCCLPGCSCLHFTANQCSRQLLHVLAAHSPVRLFPRGPSATCLSHCGLSTLLYLQVCRGGQLLRHPDGAGSRGRHSAGGRAVGVSEGGCMAVWLRNAGSCTWEVCPPSQSPLGILRCMCTPLPQACPEPGAASAASAAAAGGRECRPGGHPD